MARLAERLGVEGARFASPEATVRAFIGAIERGHLDGAAECLAPESSLITPDGTSVNGPGSIRGVLAQLIAQRPRIEAQPSGTLIAGEVAYVNQRWLFSHGRGSGRHEQLTAPILVLVRVAGEWKLAIAAPWRSA